MNEYFLPGSVPATNAPGSSATVRGEFANVAAAFDKLPVMAGNANEFVVINSTGTSMISSGFSVADVVTLAGAQPLTNKTLSWANNTWVGFGDASAKNAGTGAGQVLLLAEADKLPVLNGANLTNINPAALGVVPVTNGGTGGDTLVNAQLSLGINLKADIVSPAFSGSPTCPTPADGDNSPRLANTFFVNRAIAGVGGMTPSNTAPSMDGVGASGVSVQAARGDHVHPSDTSRAPINSPAFTGNPTAPTPAPGDNDTSIATTAFVTNAVAPLSNSLPLTEGAGSAGVATSASRADHVHPAAAVPAASAIVFTPGGGVAATNVQAAISELDTEKAPLASPAFTGSPTAPTPAVSDNDTSIATTAFVQAVVAAQPAGMSPSNNIPLMAGVASSGVGVTGSRDDHVHPVDTSRAATSTLVAHTGDLANPHAVTKSQVGLGSVDNTSDATKNAAVTTLTNKTLNLSANTLVCTFAQLNTAVSDADLANSALVVGRDSSTGAASIPSGTTAQRPAQAVGKLRFNTDFGKAEVSNGTTWGSVGGGATGGSADDVFYENAQAVTTDYTITAGKNAMSAGPITIANGVTVTVPNGSVWSIV